MVAPSEPSSGPAAALRQRFAVLPHTVERWKQKGRSFEALAAAAMATAAMATATMATAAPMTKVDRQIAIQHAYDAGLLDGLPEPPPQPARFPRRAQGAAQPVEEGEHVPTAATMSEGPTSGKPKARRVSAHALATVYKALCAYLDDHGIVWVDMRQLAFISALNLRTTQRAVHVLEHHGWIASFDRWIASDRVPWTPQHRATVYVLPAPRLRVDRVPVAPPLLDQGDGGPDAGQHEEPLARRGRGRLVRQARAAVRAAILVEVTPAERARVLEALQQHPVLAPLATAQDADAGARAAKLSGKEAHVEAAIEQYALKAGTGAYALSQKVLVSFIERAERAVGERRPRTAISDGGPVLTRAEQDQRLARIDERLAREAEARRRRGAVSGETATFGVLRSSVPAPAALAELEARVAELDAERPRVGGRDPPLKR